MNTAWDPRKARTNLQKHGVCFSDAESVLFDPVGVTVEDPSSRNEQRFVTMGMDALGRVLVVVYTYRNDSIRLISARRVTPSERRQYEAGI